MRFALLSLMCFFVAACSTGPKVPKYNVTAGESGYGHLLVSAGDSVASLAHTYGVSEQQIIQTNRLRAPYTLTAGQSLKMPVPSVYKVRKHDSLHIISARFGVARNTLIKLNGLKFPFNVAEGQMLRLMDKTNRVAEKVKAPVRLTRPAPVKAKPVYKQTATNAKVAAVTKEKLAPAKAIKKTPIQKPAPVKKATGVATSGRFAWPVKGTTVSSFGPGSNGARNDGINIRAPRGTTVRAAEGGTVVYADDELKGYGQLVLIKHSGGYTTAYSHLDKMLIEKGATVKKGQTIGTVGASGSVDSPQLHFEVRKGTKPVNPQSHLER